MQKDSHYGLTRLLSLEANIDSKIAADIAWANQFTDDCDDYEKYGIRTMINIGWNVVDCFKPELQESVFVAFHFPPSTPQIHIVSPHPWICWYLVNRAIKEKDAFALGLALHYFQDSFSHMDFIGFMSNMNAKHRWDLVSMLSPRIGHAEFGHDPDIVGKQWENSAEGVVRNNIRFKMAASQVFNILLRVSGKSLSYPSHVNTFFDIASYEDRKKFCSSHTPKFGRYSRLNPTHRIEKFVEAARKQRAIVLYYLSGLPLPSLDD